MEEYLLSIVIPMYKVEIYLKKCIESLVSQIKSDIEIILVDDGSPDKSGEIAEEYAKQYSFIKIFHKTNGGLSDARNYGIHKSEGKYLWFIDSDDYVDKDSVENILKALNENAPDVMVIQSKTVTNNVIKDERIYSISPGIYDSHGYMDELRKHPEASIFCAQYQIVRKQLIIENEIFFYKGIIHEDELWTPQVLMLANSILYSGLNIYFHLMRDGSIMNSNNLERSGRCDLIVSNELFSIFSKSNRDDLDYMRDHAADTFLQAIWKIPNFLKTEEVKRFVPIKNAYYLKTRLKAVLYCVSPRLYLFIHERVR